MTSTKAAYSVDEAAAALGLSRSGLYDLMAKGLLRRVKVGRRTLIPADEVQRIAQEGTGG